MPEDGNPLITLIVPAGAELAPISHGDRNWVPYREDVENPHSRWLVRVPRGEISYWFCQKGGFRPLEAG
jgi:hypothetical protein